VVRDLETLLRHARLGRVLGLVWASSSPEGLLRSGGRFCGDTAGEAARNPQLGIEMAAMLFRRAEQIARENAVQEGR
jgi:hypothetical protein